MHFSKIRRFFFQRHDAFFRYNVKIVYFFTGAFSGRLRPRGQRLESAGLPVAAAAVGRLVEAVVGVQTDRLLVDLYAREHGRGRTSRIRHLFVHRVCLKRETHVNNKLPAKIECPEY